MADNSPLERSVKKTKIALRHLLAHPYWEPNRVEYNADPDLFHRLAIVALHYLWKNDRIGYQNAVRIVNTYFSFPSTTGEVNTFPHKNALESLLEQVEQADLYTMEDIERLKILYTTFLATKHTHKFYDPLSLQAAALTSQGARSEQNDAYRLRKYLEGFLALVLDGIGREPSSRTIVDLILEYLDAIECLSLENIQATLKKVQITISKDWKKYQRGSGSTLVLFLFLNSGEVYSISIGDSFYITVDDEGLHRSTPHTLDGGITEAIGAARTLAQPVSIFTKKHTKIPNVTILASDGFSEIERFSPEIIHIILRDTAIPPVLIMAMIRMLSGLVMGMNADNSTSVIITHGIDDEPTQPLLQ